MGVIVLGRLLFITSRWTVGRKRAMRIVSRAPEPRTLAPMIDAIRYDPATRKPSIDGLIVLLPKLRGNDASLLKVDHRKTLNILLMRKTTDAKTVKLRCATLTALEQVGDATALPVVTDLAYGNAKVAFVVREAAIACLPALSELLSAQHGSDELLRASGSGADAAIPWYGPLRQS